MPGEHLHIQRKEGLEKRLAGGWGAGWGCETMPRKRVTVWMQHNFITEDEQEHQTEKVVVTEAIIFCFSFLF